MLNNKLTEVLKTLDKKEFRKLGEFTASPYFNKNDKVIKLFELLSHYHPDYSIKKLTIESLYEGLFPGEDYDYFRINNVISDLYKVTENFLVVNHYMNASNPGDFRILEQLRNKKLFKQYKQKYKSFIDDTKLNTLKDEGFWYNKHKLIAEYRMFLYDTAPNTELNTMQDEFDYFLNYSIIKMLRFYSVMMHENMQTNVKFDLRMSDQILGFLDTGNLDEPPLLTIYKNILHLYKTKDEKYYNELKKLKDKHFAELSEGDKSFLFVHLWDFIAYKLMIEADYNYYQEAFLHNKESLDTGRDSKEKMSFFDFLNYVKIASTVGEYEWVESFINEYKVVLPPEEYDNSLNFSYGTIEQKKGNYEKALSYFARTNFSSYLLKVQVKIIQCRLFFELKMFEQALSAIDSFRHYLQREKMLTEAHKGTFYEFLIFLGQLIRAQEIEGKKDKQTELGILKNEVNRMSTNTFGVKLWLIDKINGYLKTISS